MTEFGETNLDPNNTFQIPYNSPRPTGGQVFKYIYPPLIDERIGIYVDGVEYRNTSTPWSNFWTDSAQTLTFRIAGSDGPSSFFNSITINTRVMNLFLAKKLASGYYYRETEADALAANAIYDNTDNQHHGWYHYSQDFTNVFAPAQKGGWGWAGNDYFGRTQDNFLADLSGLSWSTTVNDANLRLSPWQPPYVGSDSNPPHPNAVGDLNDMQDIPFRPIHQGAGFDNSDPTKHPLGMRYWPIPDHGTTGAGFTNIIAQAELWKYNGPRAIPRYNIYTMRVEVPIPSWAGGLATAVTYEHLSHLGSRVMDDHHFPESEQRFNHRDSGVTYVVADKLNDYQVIVTASTSGPYTANYWRFPGQYEDYNSLGGYRINYESSVGMETTKEISISGSSVDGFYDPLIFNAFTFNERYSSSIMTTDVIDNILITGSVVNDFLQSNSGTFFTDITVVHSKIYDIELQISNDSGTTWNDDVVTPPRWNNVLIRPTLDIINSNDPATVHVDVDYGDGGETYSSETTFDDTGINEVLAHNYYTENEKFELSMTAYTIENPSEVFYDTATVITSQLINIQYPGLAYHFVFDGNCDDRNGNTKARSGEDDYTFSQGYIGNAISGTSDFNRVILEEPIYCLSCLSQTGLTHSSFTETNEFEWTIACWTKLNSGMGSGSDGFNFMLSNNGGGYTNDDYAFGFFSGSSNKRIMIGKANPIDNDMPQHDWPHDEWFHAMWMCKDSVVSYYENNEFIVSDDLFAYNHLIDTSRDENSLRPWIAYKYDGAISDLRIYNRELNTKERQDLINTKTFELKFNSPTLVDGDNIDSDSYAEMVPSIEYEYKSIEPDPIGGTKYWSGVSFGGGHSQFYGGAPGYNGLQYSAINNTIGTTGNGHSTLQFYGSIPTQTLPFDQASHEQNIIWIYDDVGSSKERLSVYSASSEGIRLAYSWNGGNSTTADYVIPDEWHLYTMTFSAVSSAPNYEIKWYRDAIEQKSTTYVTAGYPPSEITNSNICIGGQGAYDKPFVGSIGEVKVWNSCLTSDEVENEFNRIMSIDEHGNIEALEFDEETSTSTYQVDAGTGRTAYFEELNEIGPVSGLVGYYDFNSNPLNHVDTGTTNTAMSNPDGFERFYSCGGFGKNTNQILYIYGDDEVQHNVVLDAIAEGNGGPVSASSGTYYTHFKHLQVSGTNSDDYFTMFSVETSSADLFGISFFSQTKEDITSVKLWFNNVSVILDTADISVDDGWHGFGVTWNDGDEVAVYIDNSKVLSYLGLPLTTPFYGINAYYNPDASDMNVSALVSKIYLYERAIDSEEIYHLFDVVDRQVKIGTDGTLYTSHNVEER